MFEADIAATQAQGLTYILGYACSSSLVLGMHNLNYIVTFSVKRTVSDATAPPVSAILREPLYGHSTIRSRLPLWVSKKHISTKAWDISTTS